MGGPAGESQPVPETLSGGRLQGLSIVPGH